MPIGIKLLNGSNHGTLMELSVEHKHRGGDLGQGTRVPKGNEHQEMDLFPDLLVAPLLDLMDKFHHPLAIHQDTC